MDDDLRLLETAACTPVPFNAGCFNPNTVLPHGLTVAHISLAMNDFLNFIGLINQSLHSKNIERLESMLMQANFSSMVGEFMNSAIPKYCKTLVKNRYHNGHPDLIPAGRFPDDSVQHAQDGIEIKGSRHLSGWQGHNAEDAWLMVFVYNANAQPDVGRGVPPRPFQFLRVVGAQLTVADWQFSGRSDTSRRTITATVRRSGYDKMMANWIYDCRRAGVTGTGSAGPRSRQPQRARVARSRSRSVRSSPDTAPRLRLEG